MIMLIISLWGRYLRNPLFQPFSFSALSLCIFAPHVSMAHRWSSVNVRVVVHLHHLPSRIWRQAMGQSPESKTAFGSKKLWHVLSTQTDTTHHERASFPLSSPEFVRVIGQQIMSSAVYLLAGEPGIGKSTMVLQIIHDLAQHTPWLRRAYCSGEETTSQVMAEYWDWAVIAVRQCIVFIAIVWTISWRRWNRVLMISWSSIVSRRYRHCIMTVWSGHLDRSKHRRNYSIKHPNRRKRHSLSLVMWPKEGISPDQISRTFGRCRLVPRRWKIGRIPLSPQLQK